MNYAILQTSTSHLQRLRKLGSNSGEPNWRWDESQLEEAVNNDLAAKTLPVNFCIVHKLTEEVTRKN